MAVANIAVLLVRSGLKVLAVDWDLEAPGLDRYFRGYEIRSGSERNGLLELLIETSTHPEQNPDWRRYVSHIDLDEDQRLSILTSGRQDENYASKVLALNWNSFFKDSDGGKFIESLREDWLKEFDVTLIDSRTGITDSGGVCTIQLPDILVPVFTTNEQSLKGAKDIALRAQSARQKLAYDRMPLLVFPLPSRFDSRTQYEEAKQWLKTFADELGHFYGDWLPTPYSPLQIIEKTKLPYIAYFSFGEKLPVVTEGTSDPEGLGYAYRAAATLIGSEFRNAERLIAEGPLPDPAQTVTSKPQTSGSVFNSLEARSRWVILSTALAFVALVIIGAYYASLQQQEIQKAEVQLKITEEQRRIAEEQRAMAETAAMAEREAKEQRQQVLRELKKVRRRTAAIRPRIYIHITSEQQRAITLEIARKLIEEGFVIPGPKVQKPEDFVPIIQVQNGPNRTEVRFFRKDEQEDADDILTILKESGLADAVGKYIPGYEESKQIRPKHYEIWIAGVKKQ